MEEKVMCPKGLKSVINETARLMKKFMGIVTIHLCSSHVDYPFITVYVYDDLGKISKAKECESFTFYQRNKDLTMYRENDKEWRRMLKYIERVKP